MSRGYAIVALDRPKNRENVGHALRAVGCYDADGIVLASPRCKRLGSCMTDPQKTWRHTPMTVVDDLHEAIPFGCVPVAVDLVEDAQHLPDFEHPERAFYVFGAEDATLGDRVLSWCKHRVYVNTNRCMNLAATVNVVLYDRMVKRRKA